MTIKHVFLFIVVLLFCSCRTKQFVLKEPTSSVVLQHVFVLKNKFSALTPIGWYPTCEEAGKYTVGRRNEAKPIDVLICRELQKKNLTCTIIASVDELVENSYYVAYQDYWSWDFKPFMPVLHVSLFNSSHKELAKVCSQGNLAGMHDFPQPEDQVPLLVDLLLERAKGQ